MKLRVTLDIEYDENVWRLDPTYWKWHAIMQPYARQVEVVRTTVLHDDHELGTVTGASPFDIADVYHPASQPLQGPIEPLEAFGQRMADTIVREMGWDVT